jgi:hypothetical protein
MNYCVCLATTLTIQFWLETFTQLFDTIYTQQEYMVPNKFHNLSKSHSFSRFPSLKRRFCKKIHDVWVRDVFLYVYILCNRFHVYIYIKKKKFGIWTRGDCSLVFWTRCVNHLTTDVYILMYKDVTQWFYFFILSKIMHLCISNFVQSHSNENIVTHISHYLQVYYWYCFERNFCINVKTWL